MAPKRSASRPSGETYIGARVPEWLAEDVDRIRGKVDRSAFIRKVLEEATADDDSNRRRAVRDVLEYARRRGVTNEELLAAVGPVVHPRDRR